MRLKATMLNPRAPTFAQCVLKRARNPHGARPLPRNLRLIEQQRECVGHAPRKPNARLSATQNLAGNAPFLRLKFSTVCMRG